MLIGRGESAPKIASYTAMSFTSKRKESELLRKTGPKQENPQSCVPPAIEKSGGADPLSGVAPTPGRLICGHRES